MGNEEGADDGNIWGPLAMLKNKKGCEDLAEAVNVVAEGMWRTGELSAELLKEGNLEAIMHHGHNLARRVAAHLNISEEALAARLSTEALPVGRAAVTDLHAAGLTDLANTLESGMDSEYGPRGNE